MTHIHERIWICPFGGNWSDKAGGTQGEEYIRADIVPQWQPIETAPKDGTTEVIAWSAWQDGPYLAVCFDDGSWVVADWYPLEWVKLSIAPTHWMPLPKPPS